MRGQLDAAEAPLREAIGSDQASWNLRGSGRFALALVHQGRGRPDDARESLEAAQAHFDRKVPNPGGATPLIEYHDLLIGRFLRREAEAAIDGEHQSDPIAR